MADVVITIFSLAILLFSVIIHEVAHGSVAYSLGDPTAKYAGRLTLNPLKHLDPFGSIILPFLLFVSGASFIIGWAKPVPINPYNFRDQKWGQLKVAAVGPLSNFLVAVFFGLLLRFLSLPLSLFTIFEIIVFYNILLGLFNLIPIFPADGSHVLSAFFPRLGNQLELFIRKNSFLLILLFFFFGFRLIFPVLFFGVNILFSFIVGYPFYSF